MNTLHMLEGTPHLTDKIYLCDNVQRLVSIVSIALIWFPVVFIQSVRARALDSRGVAVIRRSLSHGDVITRSDGELDPTEDWRVVTGDGLTGYWQVGEQNQPGWSKIALGYCQLWQGCLRNNKK